MGKINSNYYNSDLNRYIGENLPKNFTSIDVDLFQIKKELKILRIAEYKHENEGMGYQQNEALKILGQVFRISRKYIYPVACKWTLECVLIRGNHPFETLTIVDYVNDIEFVINGKEHVNRYLSCSITTIDLYRELKSEAP